MGQREGTEERRTEPRKQIQASINRILRWYTCQFDRLYCRYSFSLWPLPDRWIYGSWMESASPHGVVNSHAMTWHMYANRLFLEISKVKEWENEQDGFELDLTVRKKYSIQRCIGAIADKQNPDNEEKADKKRIVAVPIIQSKIFIVAKHIHFC